MRLPRFIGLIGVFLMVVASASAAEKTGLCAVSISNVTVSSGEVIGAFEIDVTAGVIETVQNLPVGWYLTVDNDASWRTKITANTTVGAASLTPEQLKKIRLVIRKDETYLTFKLSGMVSVTKDYQKERKLELTTSDFAVSPMQ